MKNRFAAMAILIAIFSTLQLSAQDKKVTFQARGGLNLSNLTAYEDGTNYKGKVKAGFNIGGIADFRLGNTFYLQTGLMLTSKGAKIEGVMIEDGYYTDETINAIYLQVPLYIMCKIELPNNLNKLNIGIGPYVGYGIGGKSSYDLSTADLSVDTFGDNGQLNRVDAGLGMEMQFEMAKFVFILGGELGVTKAIKKEYIAQDISIRNNVSYLSVGYKF